MVLSGNGNENDPFKLTSQCLVRGKTYICLCCIESSLWFIGPQEATLGTPRLDPANVWIRSIRSATARRQRECCVTDSKWCYSSDKTILFLREGGLCVLQCIAY